VEPRCDDGRATRAAPLPGPPSGGVAGGDLPGERDESDGGFEALAALAVVQGAVVGGGLTVIANAPNPAGQALPALADGLPYQTLISS
jgi:hypothetical protein